MNTLKAVAISLCSAFIIIGFFAKLMPRGKIFKNMKSLLSVIILLILLSPLSHGCQMDIKGLSGTASYPQNSDYRGYIENSTLNLFRQDIEDFLNEKGYEFYTVELQTKKADGSLSVNGVTIRIKSGFDPAKVKSEVEKEFSISANVKVGE